jgi:hypothetical protein
MLVNKKEDVSKINEGLKNRLNDYRSPSGIRIKRGCIILLIQPLFYLPTLEYYVLQIIEE